MRLQTNHGRQLLAALSRPEELHRPNSSVTDAGFRGFELTPTLEELNLNGIKFTICVTTPHF
jgi:hypothetical protein